QNNIGSLGVSNLGLALLRFENLEILSLVLTSNEISEIPQSNLKNKINKIKRLISQIVSF
ncbi:hypothetical protein ABPG72_022040, partial [Tetrahymena utriculariae]